MLFCLGCLFAFICIVFVCVHLIEISMCFWPWTLFLGSSPHLIFHSKFMDLFMFTSDTPVSLCVWLCVCVCVSLYHCPALCVFVHRCHIIYMDEWPSQGRVTLSKTLRAVTVHSFQPFYSPLSDWHEYHVSSWRSSENHHSFVLHAEVSLPHMTARVCSINRLCLLMWCDVLNILQGAMKINKGQYRTGRHCPDYIYLHPLENSKSLLVMLT